METVRSGMVFINEVPKSEAVIPTGGVGKSGYGREGGVTGFREFANIRTYYVN
jgi:succinate-semialdehyde dehydrogenase/glutarate-semialdehyde dehydrogenase